MKSVIARKLEPGMILGYPVKDLNNNIIIDAGVKLDDYFIKKIIDRKIPVVVINDKFNEFEPMQLPEKKNYEVEIPVKKTEEEFSNIPTGFIPELININEFDEKIIEQKIKHYRCPIIKFDKISYPQNNNDFVINEYKKSILTINELFKNARADRKISSDTVVNTAKQIVNHVLMNSSLIFDITNFNSKNNYVLSHSINTAYLSVLIGKLSNLSEDSLMYLAIGSLLHDTGMLKVRDLIWNSNERLQFNDIFDIKKHTIYGIDTISRISNFNTEIAYMAYQHHERVDGSGYPKGKKGLHQIPVYSRILGIADSFLAMNSSRTFRKPFYINDCFKTLMKKEQNKFDQTYVNSLYSFFHKNYKKELLDVENTPSKILIIDSCDDFRESSKSIIENKFDDNVEIIASKNPEEAMTLVIKNFFNPDL
ncbi:MAG: HD domain-containing phosphohydrolase, partial [Candidatus Muiribacteriota bacterium]